MRPRACLYGKGTISNDNIIIIIVIIYTYVYEAYFLKRYNKYNDNIIFS